MMKLLYWLKSRTLLFASIAILVMGLALNGYAGLRWVQKTFIQPLPSPITIQPSLPVPLPSSPDQSSPQSLSALKFGHLPYAIANSNDLIIISSYAQGQQQRFEKLLPEASLALMKLIYAARDEGVWITPISGFRDLESQTELFNEQVKRRGSPEAAAQVSAPPGYSEHHTGYAIDLTDGHSPQIDATKAFAETAAFQWLTRHAEAFGFELSFPQQNDQGIAYEPWHWRFVSSPHATQIFESARKSL